MSVKVQIGGLIPHAQYAFNVYETGDIGNGCKNIGKVFNPNPPKKQGSTPIGYIGRTEADSEGYIYLSFLERTLAIVGVESDLNIVGRSCGIHKISDGDDITINEVTSDKTLIACSKLGF
jgi:hypothetical protein